MTLREKNETEEDSVDVVSGGRRQGGARSGGGGAGHVQGGDQVGRQEEVSDVRISNNPQEPPGPSSTRLRSSWGEDTAG